MMKNAPIGIFDSGIGGLTVASAIVKELPNEDIIYFGDTEHLPYGEKSKKAIKSFSTKIIRFLLDKKCKTIIIACNSASSVVNKNILELAKSIPVFNVIDPVVSKVVKFSSDCKIGVIGTKATIRSMIYSRKIQAACNTSNVVELATPLLAPMIEEEFINEKISNTIISNYLSSPNLKNINHLILACTHYPLIHKEINNYYKGTVNVIDSTKIVAKHIAVQLKNNNLLNKNKKSKHHFYVSNYTESFEKSAEFFFEKDIKLEEINLFT